MRSTKRRLRRAAAALILKRWAHLTRFGSPPPPLDQLPPDHVQLSDERVDRAHPYTTAEANDEPECFVGLCSPARGAITFSDIEQEAIDDMRSRLSAGPVSASATAKDCPRCLWVPNLWCSYVCQLASWVRCRW